MGGRGYRYRILPAVKDHEATIVRQSTVVVVDDENSK